MDSSDERLQQGIAAYKRGQKGEASRLVKQAVRLNPKNETAWLWLSGFVETDEQRRDCFKRVLAINPNNPIALERLAKLSAEPQQPERPTTTPEPPTATLTPSTQPPLDPVFEIQPAPEKAKQRDGRLSILLGFAIMTVIVILAIAYFSPAISTYFGLTNSPQTASQAVSPEEEGAVLSAVYENIAASNVENIDRYMTSIHTQSDEYQTTRSLLEPLYRDYDLTATLNAVELIAFSPEEARVRFVLETRKRSGPDFRDNIISGIFILRPENGTWKLYDQVVNDIQYFN